MAAPFDTLRLARALRDKAGFTPEHAEAAADALADVVVGQVATKQDLKDVGTELRNEIAALRAELHSEISALRAELQSEISALRAELQSEISALRTELRSEIAALRTELHSQVAALRAEMTAGFRDVEQRMTIRLGGMLVVVTGILLAAKFFG